MTSFETTIAQLRDLGLGSEPPTPPRTSHIHHEDHADAHGGAEDSEARYEALGFLGIGQQSSVLKVVELSTGNHYALKQLHFKQSAELSIHTETQFKQVIMEEIGQANTTKHPHIAPYLRIQGCEPGKSLEVLMSIYDGNLEQICDIIGVDDCNRLLQMLKVMLFQVLSALDHMHAASGGRPAILHQDIKPTNILYKQEEDQLNFYLADFGLSRFVDRSRLLSRVEQAGTPSFLAPEIWDGQPATTKGDIYALGAMTVYLILRSRVPGRFWQPKWHNRLSSVSSNVSTWFQKMLAPNPDERPTAYQLLEDRSFFNSDWQLYFSLETPEPSPNSTRKREELPEIIVSGPEEHGTIDQLDDDSGGPDMDWEPH